MPTITRFEEIEAWQTARELTKLIYSFTEEGKFSRDFGLKDQIRRAAVSIMSNILKVKPKPNSSDIWGLPKPRLAKSVHSYMFAETSNTLPRNNSQPPLQSLKKPPDKLLVSSPISNRTLDPTKSVKTPPNMKSNL